MSEALKANIVAIIDNIPFFLLLFAALLLGKYVYDRTTKFSFDHELTHRDNHAFGALFSFYLIGLMFAIGGTLNRGIIYDWAFILLMILLCLLSIVLMRISVWITDRFILPQFSVEKEIIKDRNVGTGLVVGGCCVATGLVINAAFGVDVPMGPPPGPGEPAPENPLLNRFGPAVFDTLLYFVIGQIFLFVCARFYRWINEVDVHLVIEKDDNMAMGLSYGGFLIAVGIIVRHALLAASASRLKATGAIERDLLIELPTCLVIVLFGMVLLWAARLFADKVLLSKSPLTKEIVIDQNPAAGGVEAACYICAALAFGFSVVG